MREFIRRFFKHTDVTTIISWMSCDVFLVADIEK